MSRTERRPVKGFTINHENGLYTCDVCGWWVIPIDVPLHGKDGLKLCLKKAGAITKALIEKMPELHPTQNGYGDGYLVFNIKGHENHETSVKFRVHENGKLSLDDANHWKSITPEKAEEFVRFFAEWSKP